MTTPDKILEPGDGTIGLGELRAQFNMVGTDYFDSLYATPMAVQNSEWTDFDYVGLDKQNFIEISNLMGDKIRFAEPLFRPVYVEPQKPPSKEAVILSRIPMRREIQLTQPFVPKFDRADMGMPMEFTSPYNMSVFDTGFGDLRLYNPV